MSEQPSIDEVVAALLEGTGPVPKKDVLRWMTSSDIEVLGVVSVGIMEQRHYERIQPPLTFEDYRGFMLRYYIRCMREHLGGPAEVAAKREWSDSAYIAAMELALWFLNLWNDPDVPRDALQEIKDALTVLYREGDATLRDCVVNGALEHLFEYADFADYFEDWKNDSTLAGAYDLAMEWGLDHRADPLLTFRTA